MHKNEWIWIWYSSNVFEAERTLSESSLFTTCLSGPMLFSCMYLDLIKYSYISLGHKVHLAGTSWYSLCKTCLCLQEGLLEIGFPIVSQNMGFFYTEQVLCSYISVLNLFTDISPGNESVIVQWQWYLQQYRQSWYIVVCMVCCEILWFFIVTRRGKNQNELFWKAIFQTAAINVSY